MRSNDKLIIGEIKALKELIELKFKHNKEQHDEIVKHQKITNGRVNSLEDNEVDDDRVKILEKSKDNQSATINKILGGLIVSNVFLIPMVLFLLQLITRPN